MGFAINDNKKRFTKADVAKFAVFLVIILGIVVATVILWPHVAEYTTEEELSGLVDAVKGAGVLGMLILFGLQILQIVVAFIPGEAVQLAAGMMYGVFLGSLIILIGALVSTVMIYYLVRALGMPFISKMVPEKARSKIEFIEKANESKLEMTVFLLFLIPALPKDIITYVVGLTRIRPSRFFLLSTLGRVPGVLVSAYIGEVALSGDWILIMVIVSIVFLILAAFIIFRNRVLGALTKMSDSGEDSDEKAGEDAGEKAGEDAGEKAGGDLDGDAEGASGEDSGERISGEGSGGRNECLNDSDKE